MKKNNKLIAGFILTTVAILIATIIFFLLLITPGIKSDVKRLGKKQSPKEEFSGEAEPEYERPGDDEVEEFFGDDFSWDDYFDIEPDEEDEYSWESFVGPQFGVPAKQDILQSDKTVEYDLSVSNDYLTEFAENINAETSYEINWDFISYGSGDGYVSWVASYYELSGDIPNLDKLNAEIYERCTYVEQLYLYYMNNDSDAYYYSYEGKGTSQVTYNDENFISILVQNECTLNGSTLMALDTINIDLVEGRILDDSEIFLADQGIVQRFVEQNELQNGDSRLLTIMNEEDVLKYLTSSNTCIVFFSDKGMEIGFSYIHNYFDENKKEMTASGYVTITLNDYENYLVKKE